MPDKPEAKRVAQLPTALRAPVVHRQDAQLEQLIGFFVNSLAMRLAVQPFKSFAAMLKGVRDWSLEAERYRKIHEVFQAADQVRITGRDTNISFSTKGRKYVIADGKLNMPDGEIFTSPVETSVNGWVRFKYPAIFDGQEIEDIELWFENGKVVKETAKRNQALLTAQLNTDKGARFLGDRFRQ